MWEGKWQPWETLIRVSKIRRSLGAKIHCSIMEVLQCQDEEMEPDSRGPREPSVVIKQWTDMLEGRFIKKLVRTLKSDSKVHDRWKGRCQVCCGALTCEKGAFVLQCLGNVPGRWQPGRLSCRVCSMSADDSSLKPAWLCCFAQEGCERKHRAITTFLLAQTWHHFHLDAKIWTFLNYKLSRQPSL